MGRCAAGEPGKLSAEFVAELAVHHLHLHPLDGYALHHPRQKLAADVGQHGVGQDRVDHATARFALGAARDHQFDDIVAIGEGSLVGRSLVVMPSLAATWPASASSASCWSSHCRAATESPRPVLAAVSLAWCLGHSLSIADCAPIGRQAWEVVWRGRWKAHCPPNCPLAPIPGWPRGWPDPPGTPRRLRLRSPVPRRRWPGAST